MYSAWPVEACPRPMSEKVEIPGRCASTSTMVAPGRSEISSADMMAVTPTSACFSCRADSTDPLRLAVTTTSDGFDPSAEPCGALCACAAPAVRAAPRAIRLVE